MKYDKSRVADCSMVEVRETAKGKGLYALCNIGNGQDICVYDQHPLIIHQLSRIQDPEQMSQDDFDKLKLYDTNKGSEYGLSANCKEHNAGNCHLLPSFKSVGGWMINHSCKPNVRLGEVLRAGNTPIKEGQELTTYYNWIMSKTAGQKCLCGEPLCYGTMGLVAVDQDNHKTALSRDIVRTYIRNVMLNNNRFATLDSLATLCDSVYEGGFVAMMKGTFSDTELAGVIEFFMPKSRLMKKNKKRN